MLIRKANRTEDLHDFRTYPRLFCFGCNQRCGVTSVLAAFCWGEGLHSPKNGKKPFQAGWWVQDFLFQKNMLHPRTPKGAMLWMEVFGYLKPSKKHSFGCLGPSSLFFEEAKWPEENEKNQRLSHGIAPRRA